MALNQEYFNSINFDLVLRKYYNAGKVDSVFRDIRDQAIALNSENENLKDRINLLGKQKEEISNILITARSVGDKYVVDAQAQADEIISKAQADAEATGAEAAAEVEAARAAVAEEIAALRAEAEEAKATALAEAQRILSEAEAARKAAYEEAEQIKAKAEEQVRFSEMEMRQAQEELVGMAEKLYSSAKEQHQASIAMLDEEWQSFLCGVIQQEDKAAAPKDLEEKVSNIADAVFAMDAEE